MVFSSVAVLLSLFSLNYAMYYDGNTFSASPNVIQGISNTQSVQSFYFNDFTANGLDYPVAYQDTLFIGYNSDNDYLVKIDHNFDFTIENISGEYLLTYTHTYNCFLPLKTFDDYDNNYVVTIVASGACDVVSYSWYGGGTTNGNNTLVCSMQAISDRNDVIYHSPLFDNWSVDVTISLLNSDRDSIYDIGYANGYNTGLGSQEGWHLDNMLYSIIDIPVLYLRSMFDFSLFGGISLFAVIASLVTISIVVFILRKFLK